MGKLILTTVIVVGLLFPSAGACIESLAAQYVMPCCAGESCAMSEQMRGGSCCAQIQGQPSSASMTPSATPVPMSDSVAMVRIAPPDPADPLLIRAYPESTAPFASYQHPLQI